MSNGLTAKESSELARHEKRISEGLQSFVEVGTSLMAIRDGRLYRASYVTFDKYTKDKWDFTKSRANQLIGACEVRQGLTTTVAKTDLPRTERASREVAKAPKEKQAEVVKKAAAKAASENREPTAKDYAAVVGELAADPPDDQPVQPSARSQPAKSKQGTPKDSADALIDTVIKQHMSPAIRMFLKIAECNGGKGKVYKDLDDATNVILRCLKQMRNGAQ